MLYFAKWKIILVLVVSLGGILFALPNVLSPQMASNIPGWLPNKQVHLGLDLQGGSHLLLEVGVGVVVAERMQSVR
ncbi:MAG: protein translocase subunit SecD, partial [Alphaproteobacteria bacterium]